MTNEEFLRKYQDYETDSLSEALAKRDLVILEEKVDIVVAGPFLGKFCLMLRSSAASLRSIGVIKDYL